MKIGVIGLGSIGERHIQNLSQLYPHASIEVLTKRKKWKDSSVTLVSSSTQFFKTRHDVYIITNETVKHIITIRQVLKQKPKGIFVEKPLSHTLSLLSEIKKIAQRQGTVVFVGYNLQFFKPLLKIKKLIEKKTIGNIISLRASAGQDLRLWRKGDYRRNYSADTRKGGGVVLDLIHDLNYPSWLLGEPLSFISGFATTAILPIASEDIAESIFSSPNGTLVSIHQDYLRNPGARHLELIGTKGVITWEWNLGKTSHLHIDTQGKRHTTSINEDKNNMYFEEMKWFMKKVREGKGYSNIEEAIRDIKHARKIKHN